MRIPREFQGSCGWPSTTENGRGIQVKSQHKELKVSLLFDFEALVEDGGLTALQSGQRDFSPYVIHFTSYYCMAPVRTYLSGLGKGTTNALDLIPLLQMADTQSANILSRILDSGSIRTNGFHYDYEPAVCLTECTLPGVLVHSARYGRYGLLFHKDTVIEFGGRPLAHIPSESRDYYITLSKRDTTIRKDLLHLTTMRRPGQPGGQAQDYTHEREWRCEVDIPVSRAEALIVAKSGDCQRFATVFHNRPILPLDVLYRLGV